MARFARYICTMALSIASLNSGSNGNCYYVGSSTEAVLIDAGISCRETEKRMKQLSLEIRKVKAIFISHEHIDHIRGVEALSTKYELPVYITPPTLQGGALKLNEELVRNFKADEEVKIGSLKVTPFTKLHDAADPHSFTVTGEGVNIGVLTDLGSACSHVVKHFSKCHAVFLESNYDHDMLMQGRYPVHLKRRISGDNGHLSNEQALELFRRFRSPSLSHVLLSHLSKENNDPQRALACFMPHAGPTTVTVASRYEASPVYHITGLMQPVLRPPVWVAEQIRLF